MVHPAALSDEESFTTNSEKGQSFTADRPGKMKYQPAVIAPETQKPKCWLGCAAAARAKLKAARAAVKAGRHETKCEVGRLRHEARRMGSMTGMVATRPYKG